MNVNKTKHKMDVEETDLFTLMLIDINKEIEIIIEEDEEKVEWSKDLSHMPVFTIKEIEDHRVKI